MEKDPKPPDGQVLCYIHRQDNQSLTLQMDDYERLKLETPQNEINRPSKAQEINNNFVFINNAPNIDTRMQC